MSWYFQCQTWAAILSQIKKKKKNVPEGGEIQIDGVLRFGGRSEPKLSGRFLACAMTKSPVGVGGGGLFRCTAKSRSKARYYIHNKAADVQWI